MHRSSKKHKSKSQEKQPGWIWDGAQQEWYYPSVDSTAVPGYNWTEHDAANVNHEEIPRDSHASSVEHVTEGMGNLSHESYDAQPEDESYTVASGSKGKSKSSKSNRKGKGKSTYNAPAQREYADPSAHYQQNVQEASAEGSSQPTYNVNTDQYLGQASYDSSSTDQSSSYGTSYSTDDATDYDYDSPEVLAARSGYNQSYLNAGESSMAGTYDYDVYEEDDGPATPKAPEGGGTTELFDELEQGGQLDPRYRVRPSSTFQPGTIFMTYWAEPKGDDKHDAVSSKRSYENKLGEKFYYSIRRFIVVANDLGHATVVPVLTYGRKACRKRGVKPEKHGIIYQYGGKARLLEKEPQLGFPPVRAVITEDGEKLAKESRVNYSKLTTVEHNFRVLFIGYIYDQDFDIVSDAVNACWEAKTHHKRKHRR